MPYVALDFDKTEEAASRHSAHGHCIANDPVVLRCASSTSALRSFAIICSAVWDGKWLVLRGIGGILLGDRDRSGYPVSLTTNAGEGLARPC
jgi:hypothetical protein